MPKNFSEQFKRLESNSPKIILTEVKNHNEMSGSNIKKQGKSYQAESQRNILLSELQNLLKALADVSDSQIQEKNFQFRDPIIQKLQDLQSRAQKQKHKQVQKLCMLAIGKRILNIQLKKKKEQFLKKQQKKSQIQQFFRQNRIKKFDYDSLVQQKLNQNTLIVRPYSSGKGFIGSGNDYQHFQSILTQCNYINVVREVNRIFFDIFSGKKKDQKAKIYDVLFKILWIPIAVFLGLIITLPFYTFPDEEIILTIIMSIIVLLLAFVTISTYLNVPDSNNQMEQSIQDTKKYFQKLNMENSNQSKQFEWICPQNFMYLEVKFNRQIQQSKPDK